MPAAAELTKQADRWVLRHCADMETGFLYTPQPYPVVEPWDRAFIWSDQVGDAFSEPNLRPS